MQRLMKYRFFTAHIFALQPIIGYYMGGIFLYWPIYVAFVLTPAVDYLTNNSGWAKLRKVETIPNRLSEIILLSYAPIQFFLLGFSCYMVSHQHLTWSEWCGFVISVGIISGAIGVTAGHELIHRKSKVHRLLGNMLTLCICYAHFYRAHQWHHATVATPNDPSSAKLGESFYQFYPRTVTGCIKNAWALEQKRLERTKRSAFSLNNHFWWIILIPLLVTLALFFTWGLSAACFFLLQSIIAFSSLEVISYVQHYGLQRRQLEKGKYERVSLKHAWDSNHWLTNMALFQLPYHPAHHINGSKPFHKLKPFEESPQLPYGYSSMLLIALIPPLWFKLMNPRVEQYSQAR